MNKLIIAKSLRTSFNKIQSDLLTAGMMDDSFLLHQVREMQDTYKEFRTIADDLKKNNRDDYDKLLGL
tara:strand:- start:2938 stop:3141 length:204 start_codon:yes stop_codon:yes gene_type:complete